MWDTIKKIRQTPLREWWPKTKHFFVHGIFHLDDTPHRIALGVAIGMFVAWTPTIPFQMMLTVALCFVLRANKVVGLPFVWLTNPVTLLPVYTPNLFVGQWLLGKPVGDFSQLQAALDVNGSILERGQEFFDAILPIFMELWIGSLVVAAILGVGSYFTFYQLTMTYRRRHADRLAKKHPAPGP
jgi:uncharacterized protein (DUF2062 family)